MPARPAKKPAAKKLKVYVSIYYAVNVVSHVASKEKAVAALKKTKPAQYGETTTSAQLGRTAVVYWSPARKSYWFRLRGDVRNLDAKHVPAAIRPHVPTKEPA